LFAIAFPFPFWNKLKHCDSGINGAGAIAYANE
jgi:hypothetical protein